MHGPALLVSCLHFVHDTGRRLDRGSIRALRLSRDELAGRSCSLRGQVVTRAIDDYVAGKRRPCSDIDCLHISKLTRLADQA